MFTKLFSSITTSSIWNEDNNTRIVWITLLAMSNRNGYIAASVGGLAHESRVTRDECEQALKVLTSPDDDSRSKEFEGRRLQVVDGGFQLLNYEKYRSMRSEEERKEYMKTYMVEYRARTKNVNNSVNNVSECKPPLAKAEADEIRGEAEEKNTKRGLIKPTALEVTEYAKSIGFSLEGQDFLDYYDTRGWKLKGGQSVKDWQACVRTWKKNEHNMASGGYAQSKPKSKMPTAAEAMGDIL